jgi:hypothetical protein
MKYLAHFFIGAACFWLGVAHEYSRRPPQVIYRSVMNPLPASQTATCKTAMRLCKAQDKKT